MAQCPVGGETTELIPLIMYGVADLANCVLNTHVRVGAGQGRGVADRIRAEWLKTTSSVGSDIFLHIFSEGIGVGEPHVAGEVKRPVVLSLSDLTVGLMGISLGGAALSLAGGDSLAGPEGLPVPFVKILGQVRRLSFSR